MKITASILTASLFLKTKRITMIAVATTIMTAVATMTTIQKTIFKKLEALWYNMSKGKNSVMPAQHSILMLVLASKMSFVLLHSVPTPLDKNLM